MQKSPALRSGFTLVELLVVIAIIGILAGLLLPALAKAKENASSISGLNNMQVGTALRVYEGREGMYPPYDGDGFVGILFATKDLPDLRCFRPRTSVSTPSINEASTTGDCAAPGGIKIPGLAGYLGSTIPLSEAINPSSCAIAVDCMNVQCEAPFFGKEKRSVLYQDGSAATRSNLAVSSPNGATTGANVEKDLSCIKKE